MHPSHESQIPRLNKVEGQVKGVRKMIEDRRYCMDIISQIKAITSALRQVELGILETHMQSCVQDAMLTKDPLKTEEKIKEIIQMARKML